MSVLTVRQALQIATRQLAGKPDINAALEADILLAFCLQKDRSWLFAWPDKTLAPDIQQQFSTLIEKRSSGTPVSYLTGIREFWGLSLKVSPDTLIPRHETELLIETALHRVCRADARVLEPGTGTGAIAIALATERPGWQITASDLFPGALAIANENISRYAPDISLVRSNWLDSFSRQNFDLIISNPPYIEAHDIHLQQGDLRFEPLTALASGTDGLDDIRIIIRDSRALLSPGNGLLMLEHGLDQGAAVRELFHDDGWQQIETIQDLQRHDRITLATAP